MNETRKAKAIQQYEKMMREDMTEEAILSGLTILKQIMKIQYKYEKKIRKVLKSKDRDAFQNGKISRIKPMKRRGRQ